MSCVHCVELRLGRQLAVDEQVGDLEVGRLLGELLDRVAAVLEDALVAVDVRDRRAARRGVRERRVVGHQAEVVLVDLHLAEVHRADGAVRDRDLVVWPVRLSVTVRVSEADAATPSPPPLRVSVLISLLREVARTLAVVRAIRAARARDLRRSCGASRRAQAVMTAVAIAAATSTRRSRRSRRAAATLDGKLRARMPKAATRTRPGHEQAARDVERRLAVALGLGRQDEQGVEHGRDPTHRAAARPPHSATRSRRPARGSG